MDDVLVAGVGPAGLSLAAALGDAGLRVAALAPAPPEKPWQNTYGVWFDELESAAYHATLAHHWKDVAVYAGKREIALEREYCLFDNQRLQAHLLARCGQHGVTWHQGVAARVEQHLSHTRVITRDGRALEARVVVDASGHTPALLQRPAAPAVARQAAYGIIGEFTHPPVRGNQMVLMDYRSGHLPRNEIHTAPTFLYAMNLGEGRYFVEETSLAHVPGIPLPELERRLHLRLAAMGVAVRKVEHVERCLFPMNNPLPLLDQPLMGFGGAASMVHPPSGYLVGGVLRRAPRVAEALARALGAPEATPGSAARAAWDALWPVERLRRRQLYLFGLSTLMRCDDSQIQAFFDSFFSLPRAEWMGYLSDTLNTTELARTMLRLFLRVPGDVRRTLMLSAGIDRDMLRRAALGQA